MPAYFVLSADHVTNINQVSKVCESFCCIREQYNVCYSIVVLLISYIMIFSENMIMFFFFLLFSNMTDNVRTAGQLANRVCYVFTAVEQWLIIMTLLVKIFIRFFCSSVNIRQLTYVRYCRSALCFFFMLIDWWLFVTFLVFIFFFSYAAASQNKDV